MPAPKVLRAALRSSLTADGGGHLRRVRMVNVGADAPAAPMRGLQGASVVSARVVAPGISGTTLRWVVGRDGDGLILGLDAVTREFSDFGTAARAGSPARDYTDAIAATDAYEQAAAC